MTGIVIFGAEMAAGDVIIFAADILRVCDLWRLNGPAMGCFVMFFFLCEPFTAAREAFYPAFSGIVWPSRGYQHKVSECKIFCGIPLRFSDEKKTKMKKRLFFWGRVIVAENKKVRAELILARNRPFFSEMLVEYNKFFAFFLFFLKQKKIPKNYFSLRKNEKKGKFQDFAVWGGLKMMKKTGAR